MSSFATFMSILTEVTGKSCESQEVSVEEADNAFPGGVGREVGESGAASAEFGWGNLVMPKDVSIYPEI